MLLLFSSVFTYSQIGINTYTPLTTLQIETTNKQTPSKNDGILIPRVSELLNSNEITNGMLVFLKADYDNYKKGFYWKDDTQWIPFFSTNQTKADQTIAMVNTNSRFVESLAINSSTTNSIRHLTFDASTLKANDLSNFSINNSGEFVVQKPGKYIIQSIITIDVETTESARDAIDIMLLKNGDVLSPNIASTFSYPNSSSGDNVKNSTSINGYITMNAGDRLSLRFNRYYRDNNGTVLIKPIGNISTFTLRYIGS